ncbi:DUF3953 domain-containing protein [Bacillus manliponensis]
MNKHIVHFSLFISFGIAVLFLITYFKTGNFFLMIGALFSCLIVCSLGFMKKKSTLGKAIIFVSILSLVLFVLYFVGMSLFWNTP